MSNQHTEFEYLRGHRMQVNVTPEEYHRIKLLAHQTGRSLSGFMRSAARCYCDELEQREVRLSPTTNLRKPEDDA